MPATGKYLPLQNRLDEVARRGDATAHFSFRDIESIVGPLPPSARARRQWWANNSQTQAQAWRKAGWHVETVSFDTELVRFARGVRGGSNTNRGTIRTTQRVAPGAPPTSRPSTTSPRAARRLREVESRHRDARARSLHQRVVRSSPRVCRASRRALVHPQ